MGAEVGKNAIVNNFDTVRNNATEGIANAADNM